MSGIVVDLFAGGGGASVGIEAALGRRVDVAINHDPIALAVHKVNESHRRRFASLVEWADGDACWEWKGYRNRRPDGSLSYGLFCIGKQRCLAHRAAWILARGPIGAGVVVRHRCDNVACVRPDHLEIGTQADNLADMRRRGRAHFNRFRSGALHPKAKLDDDAVRAIRRLREDGWTIAAIADRHGIHPSTAHDIARGKTWGHVR